MGLDKCIMISVYHYCILENSFNPLCFPIHPLFPPTELLATTGCFTFAIVLLLPECRIVGNIEDVAFADWFLSPSNKHLRFLRVFSWLHSSFLVSPNNIVRNHYSLFDHSLIEGHLFLSSFIEI